MADKNRNGRKELAGNTQQASDQDAAVWDIPYARAEMEEGVETDSVGNPYGEDEMGRRAVKRRD